MAVDQNPGCRGPPLLLQTFVAGPLLQTLVADLCVEYCSLQGACRGGVCRRTPPSGTNLCREMAAQACYKANVFDSLPYIYIYIVTYIHTHVYSCIYIYICICICLCICICICISYVLLCICTYRERKREAERERERERGLKN